jgi:dienelactone hydrolase
LIIGGPVAAQRPAIVARPADAMIDQPLEITVSGLQPQQQIVLRSYIRKDSVAAFVAAGTYVADRKGEVRLARDASSAGTYTGIDPMGLFWSGERYATAHVDPTLVPPASLNPPDAYGVIITVSTADSTIVASAEVTRRFEAPGVRVEEVRSGDVVGRLYLPQGVRRAPVVIMLSGSEGGYESSSYAARLLAAHGFAAFAQAYFRAAGLRDELASVPVERVQRGIAWLRGRNDVEAKHVAIIGSSRGTELALLAAGQNSEVRGVIVYGTSVTTGGGLTRNGEPHPEAAWTLGNQPLPVMEHRPSRAALAQFGRAEPVRLRLLFEPGLSDANAVANAAIPVERIRADVLVVSGLDDQMGPADIAGDMLLERLARSGHQGRRVHLKYPEAGHVISIPYTPTALRLEPWRFAVGGTREGYARADVDSWPRVLSFLRTALGK